MNPNRWTEIANINLSHGVIAVKDGQEDPKQDTSIKEGYPQGRIVGAVFMGSLKSLPTWVKKGVLGL